LNLLETLRKLTSDEKNNVFVVSGRDKDTLQQWLGSIPRIGLSAEHGCFVRTATDADWTNLAEDIDLSWKTEVKQVLEHFCERTPGSFIEDKKVSLVWHYRLADQDFGIWQANECRNLLEKSILVNYPIDIIQGKKNLEIRPALMNKGEIAKAILNLYSKASFIFCAGDDRTDEDMFQIVNEVGRERSFYATCIIGTPHVATHAKYYLNAPEELIEKLNELLL
jgi:trehalose-phosphatase